MKNLFKRAQKLVLQNITGSFNGIPVWEEHDIIGRKTTEQSGSGSEDIPELFCTAVFLIPPDQKMPFPGNRIKCGKLIYDVALVEKKLNMQGNVIAYRCLCGKK